MKSAGKARSNGLYRHIRTSKEIIRNLLNYYPDHLKSKATLWLWQLRDIGILGVCGLVSILAVTQAGCFPPIVLTGVYGFLTIRLGDTSILDFIRYACEYFFIRQQFFEWRQE